MHKNGLGGSSIKNVHKEGEGVKGKGTCVDIGGGGWGVKQGWISTKNFGES